MDHETQRSLVEKSAKELEEMGAALEVKEDRFGDTKSGWWLDGVFLGSNTVRALNSAKYGS